MFNENYDDDYAQINQEVIRQNKSRDNQSRDHSGGINEQGEHIFNKTAQSAYRSEPRGRAEEVPEVLIVAGIFACRLALWFLLRKTQSLGIDVWDL